MEHDQNLAKVLKKILGKWIPDKIQKGLTETKYFDQVICAKGLKADPATISTILNMPRLTNCAELETLLGIITYLTRFQRNLSEITSPMRALLHKAVELSWQSEQPDAFHKVKTALMQTPVLSYYNRCKLVRL